MLRFERTDKGECVIAFKGRNEVAAILHNDLNTTIIGPVTVTAAQLRQIADELDRLNGTQGASE